MRLNYEPICIAPTGDRCGEGPVWHPAENVLFWTDVNRFLIHRYNPADDCVKSWFFDEPVTSIVLTDSDHILAVVLGSRVVLWEPSSNRRADHGFFLEGWPTVRLNDAQADPQGSLWLGSMRNNVSADGSSSEVAGTDGILFRIDPQRNVTQWKHGIGVSNTLAWSPDRKHFYFGDSLANTISIYDYNPATGDICKEKPFFAGFNRGLPDGSTVDAEGFLWNCRFYGGCVVRVAPDGCIDTIIEMPVSNVTSCIFGGVNLNLLYVTTASVEAPASEQFAGGLFVIETNVRGQVPNRFRIPRGSIDHLHPIGSSISK
jgi:sugar lactone lactonase YvrE